MKKWRNQQQITWYKRIHKQPERQNSRNHPISTAKRKKKKKNGDSVRDFCDNIKHSNISTQEICKGEGEGGERNRIHI